MTLETISEHKCFDGVQGIYSHDSVATGTRMRFSLYRPPQADRRPVPVLWWLSGLGCTEENFTVKAGAQRYAAERGMMIVAPDTSPRGRDSMGQAVPDDDAEDFGQGAGFYLDATREPWSRHFLMYSYVVGDLPREVFDNFPGDRERQGIFGHSMGGHGALTIALRHPEIYRSVSAFAPISAPTQCPWGQKAFTGYLGGYADGLRAAARGHDATALIEDGASLDSTILVDQGTEDEFLAEQLKPEKLAVACEHAGQAFELRMQPGYDHSYFFIASYMGDHIAHHAAALVGR